MADGNWPSEEAAPAAMLSRAKTGGQPRSFLLLVFGFGLAAGLLLAFSGYGFGDSAAPVISMFFALILLICIVVILAFLFRKRLMKDMFSVAMRN